MEYLETFLAICGGITIVGGAGTAIYKALNPAVRFKKRVEKLEKDADDNRAEIKEVKELQAGTIRALVAIIDHEITGNHIDGLRKTKDDIMKLLTEG